MKRILVVLLVFIAASAALWFFIVEKHEPTGTKPAATADAGYSEEHSPYYSLKVSYATSTPLAETKNETALALMKTSVKETIAQFKKDGNFDHLTPEDIQMMGFDQGRQWFLETTYATSSSTRTVSYIYETYEFTGGAHGNTAFTTFVFDRNTGNRLSLSDIFTPGSAYLDRLSALSRAKLPAITGANSDASFIEPGTTADAKNFENFYFDGNTLVLVFPPYQVGPYALGVVHLSIPTKELSSVLKPEYQ